MTDRHKIDIILILFFFLGIMVLYNSIQLITSRNTLAEQRLISDQQEETINTLKADKADLEKRLARKSTRLVTITAYTSIATKHTAIMTHPKPGTCAVSQDLLDDGWTFGKKVYLAGLGIYTISDLMNNEALATIDIFMDNRKEALEFGKWQTKATVIQ